MVPAIGLQHLQIDIFQVTSLRYAQWMDIEIQFRYTICAKELIAKGIVIGIAHSFSVRLRDVPEERWSGGERDASVLWQAENQFLKHVKKAHLSGALVEWEAIDSEGKKLSQFWFNHVAMSKAIS